MMRNITIRTSHFLWGTTLLGLALVALFAVPLRFIQTLTYGGDFTFFWAAPLIANTHILTLFSFDDYMRALADFFGKDQFNFNQLPYAYPLHSLFFYRIFSLLPFRVSFVLWSISGLILMLLTLACSLPSEYRRTFCTAFLFAPITFIEICLGQNGFFISAGALGVLLLIRHEKFAAAGMLLGCLTIKPHLFILWPIALIMQRQWRVILFAAATTIALLAVSVVVYGIVAWQQWLAVVPGAQWDYTTYFNPAETPRIFQMTMPGLTVSLRLIGVSLAWVASLQGLLTIMLAGLIAWAFRRPLTLAQQVLLLSSASLLATPYAFNYDMVLFTIGLVLTWLEYPPQQRSDQILAVLAYYAPLLIYVVNFHRLPMIPLVLLAVFVQCLWSLHRPLPSVNP